MPLFEVCKLYAIDRDRYKGQPIYYIEADKIEDLNTTIFPFHNGRGWLVTQCSVIPLEEAIQDAKSNGYLL